MAKKKCKNCTKSFSPIKKYKNSDLCSICRDNHKNCEICDTEIFIQARTCSKECAYELRKKSWIKSCGTSHNFSKKSISRKKWEKKLLNEENIINVGQRKSVQEKIKNTCREKYNGIDNPFGVKAIHDKIRKNEEKDRKWIPLSELSDFQLYRKNVLSLTRISLQKFNYLLCNYSKLEENVSLEFKYKWCIDHKFSIKEGFKNSVDPGIISSIINLEVIRCHENSAKNSKCSISLSNLIHKYKTYENKIGQKD